jgi:DNA-binding HxlR family transcriptional regulator
MRVGAMSSRQVSKRDGRYARQLRRRSTRELLGRLSAKWTMPVLEELASAPDRRLKFSEIKSRLTGVSQRMLAATLKALERDGLLLRCSDRDRLHGSGYVLTPLGAGMLLALEGFIRFTVAQWRRIEVSRRSYDNGSRGPRVCAGAANRVSAATPSARTGESTERRSR